jgi:hypothetical protein
LDPILFGCLEDRGELIGGFVGSLGSQHLPLPFVLAPLRNWESVDILID